MKHTIQTTDVTEATFSFEGGYEEIFVYSPSGHHVLFSQNGSYLDVPASDFRAFLKALSEWADEAGIAQVQS